MGNCSLTTRLSLLILVFAGVALLATPQAQAITYGEPDCADNATNTDCRHPNTVSLTGFRRPPRYLVATGRCSGSLIAENANRFIILTAGHCAGGLLRQLQNGVSQEIGISFDAEIVRNLPRIGPVAWSAEQFIIGGQPVLSRDYGPPGKSAVKAFDFGVIVFDIPRDSRFTTDWLGRPLGDFVDFSEIPVVNLPEEDYLVDKITATDPLPATSVGYGTGEFLAKPGEGGNAGGVDTSWNSSEAWDRLGVRWMTEHTSVRSFMGRESNLLFASQNPALGNEGTGYGDSGGPLFYDDHGVEIQIGITSSGDTVLRAAGFVARTDSARAVEFLDCVTAPDAELEDILSCGCTEVTDKGVCPAE